MRLSNATLRDLPKGIERPTYDRSKLTPGIVHMPAIPAPRDCSFAKLSAASTMAIAPILILGWFSQKQLVRGLTFGAVK